METIVTVYFQTLQYRKMVIFLSTVTEVCYAGE